MEVYEVQPMHRQTVEVRVPSSKSILARALLLSAFTEGDTQLICSSYGEDTRALLGALSALGVNVEHTERGLLVHGGTLHSQACLSVGSAGTAARFLTAMLAFRGGDYELHSSPQMENRPMGILTMLERAGVRFEYLKTHGSFPFRMHCDGISAPTLKIDTDMSTQYASGLLIAAATRKTPLRLELMGRRTDSAYVKMTCDVIEKFGATLIRTKDSVTVSPIEKAPTVFEIEPDVSGACYFFALSLLLSARVRVRGIHFGNLQGDMRFLELLRARGVLLTDTSEGILADGTNVTSFGGFCENMQDFSDQTLTVAALAPFATSPTRLCGIAHIRRQECDRVQAIVENLTALGVPCSAADDEIVIHPAPIKGGRIRTFEDHRVAMAFTLIGLKCGNITIENPLCCRKTFENYFELIDELTK